MVASLTRVSWYILRHTKPTAQNRRDQATEPIEVCTAPSFSPYHCLTDYCLLALWRIRPMPLLNLGRFNCGRRLGWYSWRSSMFVAGSSCANRFLTGSMVGVWHHFSEA